jgi:O6-methylguanine-DNA--protein-cysteine methyltransferase
MNLIQDQATRFYEWKFNEHGTYQEFISEVRTQLYEYRKDAHKLEFLDYLLTLLKQGFDKHLVVCTHKNEKGVCGVNKNYENSLFFIQNERDEVIESLPKTEFNLQERTEINESLQKILEDLNKIKIGQEFTYDDIVQELNELKEFYFLNKKHWSQMLIGRLTEMVASGVISETLSKDIVETVLKNYNGIIQ